MSQISFQRGPARSGIFHGAAPKLLYITAQHEGLSHSSISGIFGKYLRTFMSVVRVLVTGHVAESSRSGDDIFISKVDRNRIFREIEKFEDLDSFDFILVRNYYRFLKQALRARQKGRFGWFIGFQQSYPFAFQKYYLSAKYDRSPLKRLIKYISYRRKEFDNRRLLSKADFFVPISMRLRERFHPYYGGRTHPLGMGIDPELLNGSACRETEDGVCRFIYIGAIHPIREPATILRGFAGLEGNWVLDIYTKDTVYCRRLILDMNRSDERIRLHEAIPRQQLLSAMQRYDVGINLMPDNPVWQTASPTKLMEYYACGIPCLMTPIPECLNLFDGKNAGWFCEFEAGAVHSTLRHVMMTTKQEMSHMGNRGREIIMQDRNYQKMSEDLFHFLRAVANDRESRA